jgi:hypothetical protein
MYGTGVDVMVSEPAGALAFPGRTGRGLQVAVIDSGVHAWHPHIRGVAGGVTIGDLTENHEYIDTLGHGTAVMAAIKEKAPEAKYFAVRVFEKALRASIDVLVRAVEWCIEHRMDVINLSLGTTNPAHTERLEPLIARAARHGLILVSACEMNGMPALPGSLAGVIGVTVDWNCRRTSYSYRQGPDGLKLCASGYPRAIPGVRLERNLHGISFAVANATGFVVRACENMQNRSYQNVCCALIAETDRMKGITRSHVPSSH